MSAQTWFSDTYSELLLPAEHFVRINPVLPEKISLDDAARSLKILPAVAEREYERNRDSLPQTLAGWKQQHGTAVAHVPVLSPAVTEPAHKENISAFFPSRLYYATHRDGRPSIDLYIDLAEDTLVMVSVNLATGIAFDGIVSKFRELILTRKPAVRVTVSLPDPKLTFLFETLAPVFDMAADEIRERVSDSLKRLARFADELPSQARQYLTVRVHRSIPSSSAIIIDHRTPKGRIQLETKPYGAGMQQSYGFEVRAGSQFYRTLTESYDQLLNDGESYI